MRVLLVVDVQNDFCPGGGLAVPEGDQVVAVANRLMRSGNYDLIVATKDWHPEDHSSFADRYPGAKPFEKKDLGGRSQTLWPRHCVQGSRGAEIHGDLEVHRINFTVPKGEQAAIDSYSGFFDNAREAETGLASWLREQAAARGERFEDIELDVVGLALDYCVGFTALDACSLGLKTRVVLDACRAVNIFPDDGLQMLRKLTAAGCEVVESREVLEPSRCADFPRPEHGTQRNQTLNP